MRDVDDYEFEQYEILIEDQNLILGGRHFCKFGNIDYSKQKSWKNTCWWSIQVGRRLFIESW